MKHKYLDDAKIPYKDGLPRNDSRRPKWAEERKTYGFDERETWSLKETFLTWLYERIMMYKEVSDTDFSYWTFDYKGETLSHGQALDRILENIRVYYDVDGAGIKRFGSNIELWNNRARLLREIGELWALILPGMWW